MVRDEITPVCAFLDQLIILLAKSDFVHIQAVAKLAVIPYTHLSIENFLIAMKLTKKI